MLEDSEAAATGTSRVGRPLFVTNFSLVPAFVGGGTSGESARSFRVKVMGNVRVFFESSKNSSRFVRRPQVADDDDGDDDDDGYSASVARRVRVW